MSRPPGHTATETRSRILDTARQLFRDQGFSGTSMRDLSERLGITTAALYYHFDGKDAILDGLLGPFLEALRAVADAPAAPAAPDGPDEPGGPGGPDAPGGPDTPDASADDPEVILRQLAAVLIDHGAAMYAVLNDPSARVHIFARREFPEAMMRVERMLAGSDDEYDLLRARCALGVLQRGLVTRLKNHWPEPASTNGSSQPEAVHAAPDVKPTEEELAVVVAFAMAGLRSTPGVSR